jgi:hypothetical protein
VWPTRWPDPETVTDESQGVPLAMIQDLAGYWATDYDWHRSRSYRLRRSCAIALTAA